MGFGHFFHWFLHFPLQFFFSIPVINCWGFLSLAFEFSLLSFALALILLFSPLLIFVFTLKISRSEPFAGPLVRGGEGSLFLSSFCCGNGYYRQTGQSCPLSPGFPLLPSLLFLSSSSLLLSLSLSLSLSDLYLPWPTGAQPVVCFSTHSAWHVHVW